MLHELVNRIATSRERDPNRWTCIGVSDRLYFLAWRETEQHAREVAVRNGGDWSVVLIPPDDLRENGENQ
jgi:hypothetical protein